MSYNETAKNVESNLFDKKEDQLKSQLYGYFSSLILSKKYAPANPDLEIVMKKFGLEFRPYVYKSRTVLLSRVIRIIEKKEKNDLVSILKEIDKYLNDFNQNIQVSDADDTEEKKTKKKKKNIFDDIFNQLG